MTSPWLGVLGAALLLVVFADVLRTTLGYGGGFLTTRLTQLGWRGALALHRRRPAHGALALGGVLLLVAMALFWLGGLWLAWTLVFTSSPQAVLDTEGMPVRFVDRLAFTGWVLVTLGVPGGLEAGSRAWELLVPVAAGSGFVMITLAISYLLPVIAAATEARQLALQISSLGGTAAAIARRGWNGRDFAALDRYFAAFTAAVTLLAERHLTYPTLHYLHALRRESAIAPSLAALDEALLVIDAACAPETRGDATVRGVLRAAISQELSTLRAVSVTRADDQPSPPAPDLEPLRHLGTPLLPAASFDHALERTAGRRRLLRALVRQEGWRWDDVRAAGPLPEEEDPAAAEALSRIRGGRR
ncbi:MAG TPA: two pore domain potassium channel family protein [Thermoanaerobaculia bacterium]|nr:two pore domain potassium channel family protein [Thermoanaerobaculia bacterium]